MFGKPKKGNLILAVDGGRSHLRAHALTPEGENLATVRETGIDAVLSGWTGLADRLAALPRKLAKQGGFKPHRFGVAVAGLAGLDRQGDQDQVLALLRRKTPRLPWHLESDARQTLRAAIEEGPVAIGILGTGSAFFARDPEGKVWRTGGWGPLLEDFGSGFELARQGFIAVLRAWDGTGPATALTEPLLNMCGAETPPDFLKSLYTDAFQPAFWAQFAPFILREARKGDLVARDIVDRQIAGMVDGFVALMSKAGLPHGTHIYLSGGIAKGERQSFDWFRDALANALPDHPCLPLEKEAYWGAFAWGKRLLESEDS